ncbi:hypothetical protein VKT23_020623 [Stygiomarasmius scandens]|uniref:Uncharacterized protein n=1 Tax=Marasmiellus scandens TaxID=2682957 RepID=A0ABR1IM80_9AGAR
MQTQSHISPTPGARSRNPDFSYARQHWPSVTMGGWGDSADIWEFADTGNDLHRLRMVPAWYYKIPRMPLGRELGIPWLTRHLRIPLLALYRQWQNHAPWSPEQLDLQDRLDIPLELQDRLTDAIEV